MTVARTVHPGSTTDRAAQIRAALKAKGWTSRDVSVRAEYYSMGSSIHVVIKNPDVPLAPVEAEANAHEKIDRDQWGDILSGGNRYVHVNYSSEANAALARRHMDAMTAAAAVLDSYGQDSNALVDIGATGFRLGRGHNGWGYSLWGDGGHIQTANEAAHLAALLAIKLQAAAPTVIMDPDPEPPAPRPEPEPAPSLIGDYSPLPFPRRAAPRPEPVFQDIDDDGRPIGAVTLILTRVPERGKKFTKFVSHEEWAPGQINATVYVPNVEAETVEAVTVTVQRKAA